MERVTALRANLGSNHLGDNIGKLKDILFLDISLEAYVR
jgi:hypothetical protein